MFEYLVFSQDLHPQSHRPVWITSRDNSVSKVENVTEDREEETLLEQRSELHVQISSSEELAKQEQCLKSWENLHSEVRDIHQLLEDFSLMVQVR
jgi:hypothetical protein